MTDPRAERVAELVKSAVECGPGQWAAFLDRECGNDPALRAEIESLLQEDAGVSQFLEKPAVHLAAESLAREGAFRPGEIIGGYEIVSLIGSGGMGEVYLAQDRELHRKVALKLVRRAMASEEMVRHFKREEHLLASLNHPNIAQLYGGGVTAEGIPFFAMEYVEGEGLDRYCDTRALTTKDRLELFRKVCSAVTYAHQHLVIHRDIKPANIRVTPDGEPKLLDFGIAKLLDSENTQRSGQTITLQGVMTPEYASPEQVAGGSISTSSDVYSLGVVLYKLLTGQSPYRTQTNRPDEIARAITEQDPERPSTAIAKTQESNFGLRASKFLKGDLDNIILMALRKEPARRYSSVSQFSEDVRRHLDGLPVLARKDTFAYRATKFIGRNRFAVSAGALVVLAVVAGLIVSLWQTTNARRQRDVAQRERSRAERINQFLHRMLSFSNQSFTSVSPVAQKKDVTVNAMLDQITPQVETELADEPEVRAQILRTIGSAYASQGQYDLAEKNLRLALETQTQLYGEENGEVAATRVELGVLSMRQAKYDEAVRLLEGAVEFYRKQRQQKARAFAAPRLAQALDFLGATKSYLGDLKGAISFLNEALEIASGANLQGSERAVLASIKTNLGYCLIVSSQDVERGEALLSESLAEFRQISSQPRWELGATLWALGVNALKKNKPDEAQEFFLESEQIYRQTLGDKNTYIATNLDRQAAALALKSDFKAAEKKARESLAMTQNLFPNLKPTWVRTDLTLADILSKAGRPQEEESYLRQASQILEEQPTKDFQRIRRVKVSLSQCLLAQERTPEAEKIATEAYEEGRQLLGRENPEVKAALANLIKIYEAEGKTDAAERLKSSKQ